MPQYEVFQHVLLIHDFGYSQYSSDCFYMGTQTLNNASISFDHVHIDSYPWPDLSLYSTIILSIDANIPISNGEATRITEFVKNGGGLIINRPYYHKTLAPIIGAKDNLQRSKLIACNESVEFVSEFVPGVKGLSDSTPHQYIPLEVKGVHIIAKLTTGQSAAWIKKTRNGRVVYFNSTFFCQFRTYGFLIEAILRAHNFSVRSVINIGLMHIDDFPAPAIQKTLEPIKSEYGLTVIDFYNQIWLPDILKLADDHDITYTFFAVFTYNDRKQEPFDCNEWDNTILLETNSKFTVESSQAIFRANHEIGLHGYNHQDFTLDNWESTQQMRKALRSAMQKWDDEKLGPYPNTYAPPNNVYDYSTVDIIHSELPSITSICGEYFGHSVRKVSTSGYNYESSNHNLLSIPRTTSGYTMNTIERLNMLSVLSSAGIWGHFIHPDDIFDLPDEKKEHPDPSCYFRNPTHKNWRSNTSKTNSGLYQDFKLWIEYSKEHYPWLRFMSTKEASKVMKHHLQLAPEFTKHDKGLTISNNGESYYELVMDKNFSFNHEKSNDIEIHHEIIVGDVKRYVISIKEEGHVNLSIE